MKLIRTALCIGITALSINLCLTPAARADYNLSVTQGTQLAQNFANQRTELNNRINSALMAGQISQAQATELFNKVQQSQNDQGAMVVNGVFKKSDSDRIANGLSDISMQVKRTIDRGLSGGSNPGAPNYGSTNVRVDNRNSNSGSALSQAQATQAAQNFAAQRTELNARINAALMSGQLSQAQATELFNRVQQSQNDQGAMVTNGVFQKRDADTIANGLNNLTLQVKRAIDHGGIGHPGSSSWGGNADYAATCSKLDGHQASVAAMIEQARNNGNLRGRNYSDLKNELDSIAFRRQQLSNPTNIGAAVNEQNSLNNRLSRLESRIQNFLSSTNQDQNNRHGHGHGYGHDHDNDHDNDHDHGH